ncbi:MAG: AbrB/MazE/SpoVT family DNA-binding domain-containing protein [Micrococcales bacterium]|nr:AbrB/MazE/SpoVT family DNA-binding domain-containing protein [Micrococcales bacterium]
MTLPAPVRRALSISAGDKLLFTVTDGRMVVEKSRDFLALAGSIPVPEDRRGATWADVLETARRERGQA